MPSTFVGEIVRRKQEAAAAQRAATQPSAAVAAPVAEATQAPSSPLPSGAAAETSTEHEAKP